MGPQPSKPASSPWSHRDALWRRALTIAVLSAALVLLGSSDTLHAALLRLFHAAETLIAEHPVAGVALFILFSALSAMLAFVSSAVLVPVALVAWGKALCLLFLWIGWIVGGAGAYSVARFLGRPAVARLASSTALTRYEALVTARAPFGLVLLFQLALPSEIPGYLLGLARYPMRRYLLALGLAELPFAVGAVYLGAGFLERRLLMLVGVGAAGVAFTLWAFHTLHQRLRR